MIVVIDLPDKDGNILSDSGGTLKMSYSEQSIYF